MTSNFLIKNHSGFGGILKLLLNRYTTFFNYPTLYSTCRQMPFNNSEFEKASDRLVIGNNGFTPLAFSQIYIFSTFAAFCSLIIHAAIIQRAVKKAGCCFLQLAFSLNIIINLLNDVL